MRNISKGVLYLLVTAVTLYIAVIYNSKGIFLLFGAEFFLPPFFLSALHAYKKKVDFSICIPEII